MRKLYSTIMMLAMMVAALSITACGGDDEEDASDNSIVGVWEVVSVDFKSSDGEGGDVKVGDRLYINADGTFRDTEDSGRWTLNGKTITFIASGDYMIPAVFEISKLSSNELVLKMDYGVFQATIKYKRVS